MIQCLSLVKINGARKEKRFSFLSSPFLDSSFPALFFSSWNNASGGFTCLWNPFPHVISLLTSLLLLWIQCNIFFFAIFMIISNQFYSAYFHSPLGTAQHPVRPDFVLKLSDVYHQYEEQSKQGLPEQKSVEINRSHSCLSRHEQ